MSEESTTRAFDDAAQSMTAANRPVFPLKLPRWSCNLRQQVYNCWESVFKMEIPGQPNNPPKLTFSVGKG